MAAVGRYRGNRGYAAPTTTTNDDKGVVCTLSQTSASGAMYPEFLEHPNAQLLIYGI